MSKREGLRFGYKLGAGLGALLLVCLIVTGISLYALRTVVDDSERVTNEYWRDLLEVERLAGAAEATFTHSRGYLLLGDPFSRERLLAARVQVAAHKERLEVLVASVEGRALIEELSLYADRADEAVDRVMHEVELGAPRTEVAHHFAEVIAPLQEEVTAKLVEMRTRKETLLREATAELERIVAHSQYLVVLMAFLALMVGVIIGLLLRRLLREQRLAQAEASRYIAQIERSNRDLEAFAGRVAHDMRGLLTPLGLLAELLPRRAHAPDKVADDARRLRRMVKTGESMVEGLLAFSRAASPAKVDEAANVAQVAHEVIEQLAPLADSLSATVESDVPEELEVACSPGLLQVVLANVVGNAVKYIAGRPRRLVYVRACAAGEGVEICVDDTGPGIPKEAQPRIFEPFYRVAGTSAAGTGIGLATVRRIVDAHQGKLAVDSELGRGTTFRFWFPRAAAAAIDLEERRSAASRSS